MLAEINGKLGGDNLFRTDRLEDELTGNFFGIMRYMPYNIGLKNIFALASGDETFENVISSISGEEFSFEFWKRHDKCEIDAYMEINNVCIGIEVKLDSPKSGSDQLEREAEAMLYWAAGRKALLLYVAPQGTAIQGYEEDKGKDCFKKVHLGYLCWEDVLESLEAIETDNPYEQIMLQDLCDLMHCKGFVVFKDFVIDKELSVEAGLLYEFEETPFTWPIVKVAVEEGLVYEFEETPFTWPIVKVAVEEGLVYEFS